MKNLGPPQDPNRLIGRWKSVDQWRTEVVLEITKVNGGFHIRAIDAADGEEAEIYDVQLVGEGLTFAAYWSSGQFTKYRAHPMGNQLEVVFTYTDTSHFSRDPEAGPSNP